MARNRRNRRRVLGWYVVQTHQSCEFEARRELSRQGFEVGMPMMRLPINRAGVRRIVPLFEGYVFVRESAAWWSIRGTRGVAHLLMGTEGPAVMADDELQFFLSVSVDDLGYYVDPVMKVYRVGECATHAHGPWSGKLGRITGLDARGRVELMYSLLGRDVRVQTQVSELA